MKSTTAHRRRRAIAGVVSAIILFLMLFTVGLSFILFVSNGNQLVAQALGTRNLRQEAALQEKLLLVTQIVKVGNDPHLAFTARNDGGITTVIGAIFVIDQDGNPTNETGPSFTPVVINPANTSSVIDTTVICNISDPANQLCILKAVTQRGNVFVQTYPLSPVPLAERAFVSQGIGLLSVDFDSFRAYNLSSGSLLPWPTGTPGYSVDKSNLLPLASVIFSINVTNLDSCRRDITLTNETALIDLELPPKSQTGGFPPTSYSWYVGNVNPSNGQVTPFPTGGINIPYRNNATLWFVVPPTTLPRAPSSTHSGNYAVFTSLFGELTAGPTPDCPARDYGQNIPLVTTRYRCTNSASCPGGGEEE